jgi:hypothetical protein
LGGGLEEEVIQEPRVSKHEGVEFVGEREDHMKVFGGQQFLATLGEPADLLQALTPGAVTVTAGVEGEALITAAVFTTLQVAPEGWGSTV